MVKGAFIANILMHLPLLITLAGGFGACHLKGFYSTSLMAFAIKLMVVIPAAILIAKGLRRCCPRLHSVLLGGLVRIPAWKGAVGHS